MDITAQKMLSDLKNKTLQKVQVIVLYGEEQFYRSELLKTFTEYIFADISDADREINIFDKDTDLRELQAVINTYPFFCSQSLVILQDEKLLAARSNKDDDKNTEKQSVVFDKLTEIISDVPDYCTLVISTAKLDKRTKFYKALKKSALLCSCDPIRSYNIEPWLNEQARLYGAEFESEAIGLIMAYLEPVDNVPLQLLQQEIAKLAVYAGECKLWSKQDVAEVFVSLPQVSDFALINFISQRKLKNALETLAADKKSGKNMLLIAASVSAKLRKLLRYLELKNKNYAQKEIMGELEIKNFYVIKMLDQESRNFNERLLRDALLELDSMNERIRRGEKDYLILEKIIVCLLASAN